MIKEKIKIICVVLKKAEKRMGKGKIIILLFHMHGASSSARQSHSALFSVPAALDPSPDTSGSG